jgi:small subunit ribosomal protein S9
MADEPQTPESAEPPKDDAAFAEHHAVPTEDAAEIAGSVEDAALEAFEEAKDTEQPAAQDAPVQAPPAEQAQPVAEAPSEQPAEPAAEEPAVADASAESPQADTTQAASADAAAEEELEDDEEEEPAPRVKPAVPGAHLEVDIVPEGVDPLGRDVVVDPYAIDDDAPQGDGESDEDDKTLAEPISTAAIDLAAGARYRATGKRKTAIARVILRPGSGSYTINGRTIDAYFPRQTLQRNIRQPLETVGYEERMDVVARLHGGGVSAQAGALRHGISRALLEADPNLRGELKRRGFLTRDSRAKERKKAGLKKARKRPQFSKR